MRQERKRRRLIGLTIEELSAVDAPANKHARALIMKRDDSMSITKTDLESALDDAAATLAKATGATHAKAYAQLLDTDAGKEALERMYDAETEQQLARKQRTAPDRADLAKASSIEDQLEAMAQAHASSAGTTVAKAYEAVLDTTEGRRLYAKICELREPF